MKIQNECRCCGSKDLTPVIDFGDQLAAPFYHRGQHVPVLPLRVDLCDYCSHRQLSGVIDPNPIYDQSFFDGYHPAYQNHCDNLVNDCLRWWKVKRRKQKKISVLDIGCGDGTLLKMFERKKCLVQGVEPAENLRELSKDKRIRVKNGYWGDGKTAPSLGRYDLVTVIGLLDKIDYLDVFLQECTAGIVDDGCILLEIPWPQMDLGFHNINHPTLSYFLASSFKEAIEKQNLIVERMIQSNYGGPRLRFFLSLKEEHCPEFQKLIEEEAEFGDVESYKELTEQSQKRACDIKEWLNDKKAEGKTVIGCGSCHEINALMTYANLDFDYMLDSNERLAGYRTPNDVLIHPFRYLQREERDNNCVILFLNPYTRHFDMKQIQDMQIDNCELVDFYRTF